MTDRRPSRLLPRTRSERALAVAFVVLTVVFGKPIVNGDGVQYYAYARSTVVDRDLELKNEFAEALPRFRSLAPRPALTPRGYTYAYAPVGAAVIWTIPLAATHAAQAVVRRLGIPLVNDGYSDAEMFAASLTSWTVMFLGVLVTYRLCRLYGGDAAAVLAAFGGWLASPVFANAYELPMFSHAVDFGIATCLVYVCVTRGGRACWWEWLLIGVLLGWAVSIRPQNVTLVLLPALCWLRLATDSRFRDRRWHAALAMAAGAAAGLAPQIAMNISLFGSPWVFHQVYLPRAVWPPHIARVLWSWDNGLFTWTPLMLLASAGLIGAIVRPSTRIVATVGVVTVTLNILLVAILPYGPVLIGQRYLINCVPFWAIGLVTIFRAAQRVRGGLAVAALTVAAAAVVSIDLETLRVYHVIDPAVPASMSSLAWKILTVAPGYWSLHLQGVSINQPCFSSIRAIVDGLRGNGLQLIKGAGATVLTLAAARAAVAASDALGRRRLTPPMPLLAGTAALIAVSLGVAAVWLWMGRPLHPAIAG